jgi:hypothetical protein
MIPKSTCVTHGGNKIMKLKFLLLGFVISLTGFSQSIDSVLIKGQVISRDNYPLANATIRVSNTEFAANSDLNGQFEIWSPIEGILEFSCISEPYRISTNSLREIEEDELIKFKFDLKTTKSSFKSKSRRGRTIHVRKFNSSRYSDLLIAYYENDFERITQKQFVDHSRQGQKIIFMIDGQIMDEDFTPNKFDYATFRKVAILRILDTQNKIIFMISTDKIS